MKKVFQCFGLCLLAAVCVLLGAVITQREYVDEQLMHFAVETKRNSPEDAALRAEVLNAVLEELSADLHDAADFAKAAQYLKEKLPVLQKIIDDVLRAADYGGTVLIRLGRENFPGGRIDMQAIPAGVYETLRIILSEEPEPERDSADAQETSGSMEAFSSVGLQKGEINRLSELPFDGEKLRIWIVNLLEKAENLLRQ